MRGSDPMSIFAKILLATDGSEPSEVAVRAAVALSKRLDSEVHVIYVAHEHPYLHAYYDLHHQEEEERLRREDKRMLDEYVDHVRQAGGTVADSYLRMGEAAKVIVELAEELDVGLVVLGSRGLGLIRRALMGSVSDSVVRHAHCPVMVIRSAIEQARSWPRFVGSLNGDLACAAGDLDLVAVGNTVVARALKPELAAHGVEVLLVEGQLACAAFHAQLRLGPCRTAYVHLARTSGHAYRDHPRWLRKRQVDVAEPPRQDE